METLKERDGFWSFVKNIPPTEMDGTVVVFATIKAIKREHGPKEKYIHVVEFRVVIQLDFHDFCSYSRTH